MSPLNERIDADLKEAMKAKNEAVLSTLRLARTALKNKQIDLMGKEMGEEETVAVLRTMVKQYKDALSDFESAGRTDLAEKQKAEIEILERYLPAAMTEVEIEKIVTSVIAEMQATPKDMGKVMGAVMKQINGRADGNTVRAILQTHLT